MRQSSGILLLTLAAMVWGLSFVAQSVSTSLIGPFTFNGIRFLLGAITLSPFVAKGWKRNVKGNERKTIIAGLCAGLALASASVLQQAGMASTSTGKAGFITSLYMIIVPFLSLFLGKRITMRNWICVFIATIGMYLLCGSSEGGFGKGEILVLLSSLVFAAHILVIDHFKDVDGVTLSCFQFLFAGLVCDLVMPFEHPSLENIGKCAIPLLYAGVMSCGIAYTLQVMGQKQVEPAKAVMPLSLESVFSTLFGFLILQQKLTMWELTGCAIVFVAVILSQSERKTDIKA